MSTITRSVATEPATDVLAELHAWLDANWSPELTVGEWWERLGLSGWAAPSLPDHAYGRGLSGNDTVQVQHVISEFGALGAPSGLGLLLAAPTIAAYGTQQQIDSYVRDTVTGQKAWCQLFSEPAAGSDLAGLQTRAVQDGDQWIVNGQKVWTSGGQLADQGMLIARTDPDVPKRRGITYFALDMHQPGVDVRPLREMTGEALFTEVFLTDARVRDAAIIGELHHGWAVANTTLMLERAGLGAGGAGAVGGASPGSIAGHLERRAGDFVRVRGDAGGKSSLVATTPLLIELARTADVARDSTVRQGLADLYSMEEIARFTSLRAKAARKAGRDIPGLPNIAKMAMSELARRSRDLGLHIVGPSGMLHAYTSEDRDALDAATGSPLLSAVTGMALFAQGPPIYGGTDQIQRNILGERVLGLPREPGDDRTIPFRDLPKNG